MNSMNPMNRRFVIVIILTLVTAVIIFKVRTIEPVKNERLLNFPMVIGKWNGIEIPMEDWVFASLETPYSILRNYVSPDGNKINLAIVWYDDKEIAFHSAAACLGGAGNKVTEMEPYQLMIEKNRGIRIGRLVTEKLRLNQLVFYYYINDGYITPNQTDLRKKIIIKRMKMQRTSAAFIRVMMPIIKDRKDTAKTLEEFVKTSLPLVIEYTDTKTT